MKKQIRNRLLLLLLIFVLLFAGCGKDSNTREKGTEQEATIVTDIENSNLFDYYMMKNPLGITSIGDPFVLVEGSTYYMYATSMGDGYKVWKGASPASLRYAGVAYQKSGTSYGEYNFWAPEVYKYNGAYYMFYSAGHTCADGKQHMAIGCAKADKPEGPFIDIVPGKPFYAPDYSVIDANILFDKSGRIYLFYARDCSENLIGGKHISQIWGIEVKADLSGVIGEPVLLLTPEQGWETSSGDWQWNEGPCAFERNGIYYLMYSSNYYEDLNYSVGCATSDSPLGTYKKYKNNPILLADGNHNSGSGHNNFFFSPDGSEMYTVYHTHTSVTERGGNRQLCVDKMVFDEDGVLSVNGPSFCTLPVPSGTQKITTVQPGEFSLRSDENVKTVKGSIEEAANGVLKAGDIRVSNDSWQLKPHGGTITLEFVKPESLAYLAVYGDPCAKEMPKSITVTVNGEYRIVDVPFSGDSEPTVVGFRNLPENTEISTIDISFSFDGQASSVTLREIIPVRVKS